MNQRREPTISGTVATGDENSAAPSRAVKRDPRVAVRESEPLVQVKTSSPLVAVAIIFALIGFSVAGFSYWQAMEASQELVIARANTSALETRILELEKKLDISDGESAQSLTSVQLQVKDNLSEIKKLWGVSYDRNRNAISGLAKEFKKTTATLKALSETAKKERARLSKSLVSLRSELALLAESYDAGQAAVIEAGVAAKEQAAKVGLVEAKVNTVERHLKKRVLENEEAIESIDAFRKQVNRDLLALKKWTQQANQ